MWGLLYAEWGRETERERVKREGQLNTWNIELLSNLPYAYPRYMDRVLCDTQAHRIVYDPLEKRVRVFLSLACAEREVS